MRRSVRLSVDLVMDAGSPVPRSAEQSLRPRDAAWDGIRLKVRQRWTRGVSTSTSSETGRRQNAGCCSRPAARPRGCGRRRGRAGRRCLRVRSGRRRRSGISARRARKVHFSGARDLHAPRAAGRPLPGRARAPRSPMRPGPQLGEAVRVGAAALEAGAMAGGERGGLVEEEQLGVAVGLHQLRGAGP